jgi:hypothetical protein
MSVVDKCLRRAGVVEKIVERFSEAVYATLPTDGGWKLAFHRDSGIFEYIQNDMPL